MSQRKRTVRIIPVKDGMTRRMHEIRKELGKTKPTPRQALEQLFNLQTA